MDAERLASFVRNLPVNLSPVAPAVACGEIGNLRERLGRMDAEATLFGRYKQNGTGRKPCTMKPW